MNWKEKLAEKTELLAEAIRIGEENCDLKIIHGLRARRMESAIKQAIYLIQTGRARTALHVLERELRSEELKLRRRHDAGQEDYHDRNGEDHRGNV